MKHTISVTQEDINLGARCHCYNCPVARAIVRHNITDCVSVGWENISILGRENIQTPRAVRGFIRKFDSRKEVKPFSFQLNVY